MTPNKGEGQESAALVAREGLDLRKVECPDGIHGWWWYEYDPEQWYEPNCPSCDVVREMERHRPCEHSHHRAWRRWKATHKLVGWAYSMGLISGSGTQYSAWCRGCLTTVIWRGSRPYLLGLSKGTWGCLRRGHRPGDPIAFGMCSKCLPCPDCGSKTAGHLDERCLTEAGWSTSPAKPAKASEVPSDGPCHDT